MDALPYPVLFFDDVCNLCDSSVQFIIKHDKKKQFMFAPLQSPLGLLAQKEAYGPGREIASVILLYNNTYYTRSAAALHTLRLLGGAWAVLYAAIIIPSFIRDAVYNFIARNRYKWFGKKNTCMIPSPGLKARFLNN